MAQINTDAIYPFRKDTYEIIGICMKVHGKLGHGFLEIVYKEAIEIELAKKSIYYEREKAYEVLYEGIVLSHRFHADFVIQEKIILEVKAAEGGMSTSSTAQIINYLKISGCPVGLLINFGRHRLEYRRFAF
jgi:GxxExxY protein